MATITGDQFDNILRGTSFADVLDGRAGGDQMLGGLGDDVYFVDNIFDWAIENPGAGNDTVRVSSIRSYVLDAEVENLVFWDNQVITGVGNALDNLITGNNANNLLQGRDGGDWLIGFVGDDRLEGGAGVDHLEGNGGNDTLDGGTGGDLMVGDIGNDTYIVDNVSDVVIENIDEGTDEVRTTLSSYSLVGRDNVENLAFIGTGSFFGEGNSRANVITGGANDDALKGGGGADRLIGGAGNDSYFVEAPNDIVIEQANQGIDWVYSDSTLYGLDVNVENLVFVGVDDFIGIGNNLDNVIIGGEGDDVLKGMGGADSLTGNGGDDSYMVDSATDTITENGGRGIDTVLTSVSYTLTAGADVETLATTDNSGTAAIGLTGNANGNTVRGNAGNNVINGGDGRDTLTGLGGADSFLFDTALNAATNLDVITDFSVADDTIRLDNAVFGAFANGGLADDRFVLGTAARDANDNILYDRATGALYYDRDGNGAAAPVQFAQLSAGLALTHLDFLIV